LASVVFRNISENEGVKKERKKKRKRAKEVMGRGGERGVVWGVMGGAFRSCDA